MVKRVTNSKACWNLPWSLGPNQLAHIFCQELSSILCQSKLWVLAMYLTGVILYLRLDVRYLIKISDWNSRYRVTSILMSAKIECVLENLYINLHWNTNDLLVRYHVHATMDVARDNLSNSLASLLVVQLIWCQVYTFAFLNPHLFQCFALYLWTGFPIWR